MVEILIKLLKSKKPLSNGKFVEQHSCKLFMNNVEVYSSDVDSYVETQQETMERMLVMSSNIANALDKSGVKSNVKSVVL